LLPEGLDKFKNSPYQVSNHIQIQVKKNRKKLAGIGCMLLLVSCFTYSLTLKMEVICILQNMRLPPDYMMLQLRNPYFS
jgi:hypothetical protein